MLILSPQTYGSPDYEPLNPGDITQALDSYYIVRNKQGQWNPVPSTVVGMPIRLEGPSYRRPVTWKAKVAAAWQMFPSWFSEKILRIKPR